MSQKLFLNAILMLLTLAHFPVLNAQPVARIYKMPAALLKRLQAETEQRQRGECEQQKREFGSNQFYSLNDKLLLLIGLPDYFCHASSFLPVTIDNLGNWNAGTVLESYPAFLLKDSSQQLWLASHWEIEAVYPILHHSIDGVHWQEISLPKERKIDCCFEYIKQVCLNKPQIQVKFSGIDDTQIGYWQTSVSESLKLAPNWQKISGAQILPPVQCQSTALTQDDWQRQITPNGAEISFHSVKQGFKVMIPRWLKVGIH